MKRKKSLTVLLFILFTGIFACTTPNIALSKQRQRIALVIGNSNYKFSPLTNPSNDATDIAKTLERLGFTVMLNINATRKMMEESIRAFSKKLRADTVGLFYFAGHGIQVDGRNYFIPIDVTLESKADLKYSTIIADWVLAKMKDVQNGLNIIIVDACRDNPLPRKFRSSNRGLTKMDAPLGSFLAFSTAPGSVAVDGTGRNGLYTSKLLKHMITPGLKIEEMFKLVRKDVVEASKEKQIPWESTSLIVDFYFNPNKESLAAESEKQITLAEGTFYSIHFSSFKSLVEAKRQWESLNGHDNHVFIKATLTPGKGTFYRVYIGKYAKRDEAVEFWEKLNKIGAVGYYGIHRFNGQTEIITY